MTRTNDTKPKTCLSAKLAAGLAISAALLVGTFSGPADAYYYRGGYYNGYGYRAPPVVYGGYNRGYYNRGYYGNGYYAPPVVYGGIGISLPFIGIGIR